jgi:hypothetical protein
VVAGFDIADGRGRPDHRVSYGRQRRSRLFRPPHSA